LREELQLEIRHIHAKLGVTIVYVTHDQSEALTMSDRIAVFEGGRIQQLGTAEDIYERPANAFVAGFIGENNRLEATVADATTLLLADGTRLETAPHGLAAGTRAIASIRPERVKLGAADMPGAVRTRVAEVVYLGDHCRLRLDYAGLPDFFAHQPRQDGVAMPRQGEAVFLGIPPSGVAVFRTEG
jgi:putative spermidine/putrescine transport system ATP-binding protein